MTEDIQAQIAKAKAAGYTDSDIAAHLGQQPEHAAKFKAAADAGYKPEEVIAHLASATPKPAEQKSWTQAHLESGRQDLANIAGGLIRGAGSIGATLMYPVDKAQDMYYGDRDKNLTGLITGQQPVSRNQERRQQIDAGLTSLIGSDPNSLLYQGAKLGGEIAGTAGAGGAIVGGTKAAPMIANYAPRLAFDGLAGTKLAATAPNLLNAIRTGGMTTGQTGGNALANIATRATGGAVTGAASAGLVDPEYAKTGAVVGGLVPGGVAIAGKLGSMASNALRNNALITPEKQAIFEAGNKLGLVAPPSQVNPTLSNQLAESLSGKYQTAQKASGMNIAPSREVIAKDLGLPVDKLTKEALPVIRAEAGKAYEAVRGVGQFAADDVFNKEVAQIAQKYKNASADFPALASKDIDKVIRSVQPRNGTFDSNSAVDAIKVLRENADKAYASGDKALGGANKAAANALEGQISRTLQAAEEAFPGNGYGELVKNFQDARQRIAKTYLADSAMSADGTINVNKYVQALKKDKPLSEDVKTLAKFADTFPKAMANDKSSRLPFSPLDAMAVGVGSAGGAFINPLMLSLTAARPLTRSALLSKTMQNRLVNPGALEALNNPNALTYSGVRAGVNPLLSETYAQK